MTEHRNQRSSTARPTQGAAATGPVAVAVAVALGACSTPTPSLQLLFAGAPTQACPSTAAAPTDETVPCGGVPMRCETVMSVRILDPADPTAPYSSQCIDIPVQKPPDMCALSGVELAPTKLPVRKLEVQVALYPASIIPPDPERPGHLLCPTNVKYSDATGYPVDQWPTPALGGRTWYLPGDSIVAVTLGCTDLAAINDSCGTSDLVEVTATVDDFETESSVSVATASLLTVSVDEPRPVGVDGTFVVTSDGTRSLKPVVGGGATPTWEDDVDLQFHKYVCIDVLEGVSETTAALRCRLATSSPRLDLSGVQIKKNTLKKILGALSPSAPPPLTFPEAGLTVGIVVDQLSLPVPGLVVTSTAGTVEYMSNQSAIGGNTTSNYGVFVSRDAPFGTVFSTAGPGRPAISAIGGLVVGKVTIVVLRFGSQTL